MAKTKKAKTTTKPTAKTGQDGPPLTMAFEQFNKDERKIIEAVKAGKTTLELIGKRTSLTSLQVRNGLRRPVRAAHLKKVDRGTYAVGKPNKVVAKAARAKAVSPKASKKKAVKTEAPARAAKPAKATVDTSAKANPQLVNYEGYLSRLHAAVGGVPLTPNEEKTGVIILAARDLDESDTKISKKTGLSRGFIIGRLKRLIAADAINGAVGMMAAIRIGENQNLKNGVPSAAQVTQTETTSQGA